MRQKGGAERAVHEKSRKQSLSFVLLLSKRYETFSESVLEFSQRLFSLHKFEENNSFQGMKNS